MSLSEWAKNDWLRSHKTSKQELEGLFSIVERELHDSQVKDISADGKFNHAYRASLTLGTILLYASGYAPAKGQSHHYRVILTIPEILGKEAKDDSNYLNNCRAKRNAAEYDAANEASTTIQEGHDQDIDAYRNVIRALCNRLGILVPQGF